MNLLGKNKLHFWAVGVVAVLALAGCGKNGVRGPVSGSATFVDKQDELTKTGGTNANGVPYTSFMPTQEIQAIKTQVNSDDQANQAFGAQIEKAAIISDGGVNSITLQVQLKGLANPLVFKGNLQEQNKVFYSQMAEASGQRADLQVSGSCSDAQCTRAKFFIFDQQRHKAAIVITKQDRVMRLRAADGADVDPAVASEFGSGKSVVVISTQIIPGRAYYEIQEKTVDPKQTGFILSGDLLATNGDEFDVTGNDAAKKLGRGHLVGNDEEGSLVLHFEPNEEVVPNSDGNADTNPSPTDQDGATPLATDPVPQSATPQKNNPSQDQPLDGKSIPAPGSTANPGSSQPVPVTPKQIPAAPAPSKAPAPKAPTLAKPKKVNRGYYLELAPVDPAPSTTPKTTVSSGNCPVSIPGDATPILKDIYGDCTNGEVAKQIKYVWSNPNSRWGDVKNFLIYNQVRLGNVQPRGDHDDKTKAQDLQKMIDMLDSVSLPEVLTFIPVNESSFDKHLRPGGAGETGYWQITPSLGIHNGLVISPPSKDQRRMTASSTRVAIKYLQDNLDAWDGNFKMALASYNRGLGGAQNASEDYKRHALKRDGDMDRAYAMSHDFWVIHHYHMYQLPKNRFTESWNYVPKVLAAIFMGVAPEAHGQTDTPPGMEFR